MTQIFNQTVVPGSSGFYSPLLFGGKKQQANVVVRNTSNVDATFFSVPNQESAGCPANAVTTIPNIVLASFQLTGNGSTCVVAIAWPEDPVPNVVNVNNSVTVSGTLTANIGTPGSLALDTSVQNTNNLLGAQNLSNGASMPFHGSFTAFLEGSGSEPTLAIGAGSAQKINNGNSLASGSGLTYKSVASSGSSVTFAACTVRVIIAFPSGG